MVLLSPFAPVQHLFNVNDVDVTLPLVVTPQHLTVSPGPWAIFSLLTRTLVTPDVLPVSLRLVVPPHYTVVRLGPPILPMENLVTYNMVGRQLKLAVRAPTTPPVWVMALMAGPPKSCSVPTHLSLYTLPSPRMSALRRTASILSPNLLLPGPLGGRRPPTPLNKSTISSSIAPRPLHTPS